MAGLRRGRRVRNTSSTTRETLDAPHLTRPHVYSIARAPPAARLLVLPAAVAYGCSDAPGPVEPRLPRSPQFLAGPTITVTNTDDAGPGSLRQAIIDARAGVVIQFDAAIAGKTIVLTSGKLDIDKAVTIEGPLDPAA